MRTGRWRRCCCRGWSRKVGGGGGMGEGGVSEGDRRWMGSRMTHEAHPVARWCFGNTGIAKNGQGYIKFVKEHKGKSVDRTKRIDLVAAWVTAMARARFYKGSTDLSAAILKEGWGM